MMLKNKKGGLMDLPVVILMGFIAIIFMIALLPGLVDVLNTAKASNSLNCVGYNDTLNPSLSYDNTTETNTIGCLAVTITPGLIVLGVLFGVITAILYGKASGGQDLQGGYQ